MLCKNPYMAGVLPFGCGQCLPCRIKKRREWTHRILLEGLKHGDSSFVTLTYDDEHLPKYYHEDVLYTGSLSIKDYQDWLKRLREQVDSLNIKIRYFIVGEYGDETWRPHYHVALFGLDPVMAQHYVELTWKKGLVHVGELTRESSSYIAGYVTKKLTSHDDQRLQGRYPEFARMSLRPGIGALAMPEIVDFLTTDHGATFLERNGDVPHVLKHGGKDMPLGRYLRQRLRKHYGFKDEKVPEEKLLQYGEEMRKLYEETVSTATSASYNYKALLVERFAQQNLNTETRLKIFKKRTL